MKTILRATKIAKTFAGPPQTSVLKEVSLEITEGTSTAIQGKSGSGKSTLLHILGTLENPTHGTLELCGIPLKEKPLSAWRNRHIGFIFQSFHLLEEYTALDNVLMPATISGKTVSRAYGLDLLKKVDMVPCADRLAKYLSGGEKQRIAIARALCNSPELILADEPSGNLDKATSEKIHLLLLDIVKKEGKTLIVVTHDTDLAGLCDQILLLKEGKLCTY